MGIRLDPPTHSSKSKRHTLSLCSCGTQKALMYCCAGVEGQENRFVRLIGLGSRVNQAKTGWETIIVFVTFCSPILHPRISHIGPLQRRPKVLVRGTRSLALQRSVTLQIPPDQKEKRDQVPGGWVIGFHMFQT